MAKNYLELPINEFLCDAAAAQPTPGGGSTAALVGALAASMARMTANYSRQANAPAKVRKELAGHEHRLARTQNMLAELMYEDMTAFEAYQAACKMDKADPQREPQVRSGMAACVAVPSEVITTCLASLSLMDIIKDEVKQSLLCDLGVAAELADAAAAAAAWLLRSSLATWPDPQQAEKLRKDLEQWESRRRTTRNNIRSALANRL